MNDCRLYKVWENPCYISSVKSGPFSTAAFEFFAIFFYYTNFGISLVLFDFGGIRTKREFPGMFWHNGLSFLRKS